jgi:hypothetical protein
LIIISIELLVRRGGTYKSGKLLARNNHYPLALRKSLASRKGEGTARKANKRNKSNKSQKSYEELRIKVRERGLLLIRVSPSRRG